MSENKNKLKRVRFGEYQNKPVEINRGSLKTSSVLKAKGKGQEINKDEIKKLPTFEYIQATVQKEVEQGLMNIALLKPSNPIEFLGNYLIEKSKTSS